MHCKYKMISPENNKNIDLTQSTPYTDKLLIFIITENKVYIIFYWTLTQAMIQSFLRLITRGKITVMCFVPSRVSLNE